ncbi:hypothetical protein SmJEL517_g00054 [Synchytrium microbalum]|uniref:FACT complex subunit n=1 Tax=Synchytrium microbalum TaxID=1806994 RepID=A0A507CJ30_9FUNG|nr:uncharacterized protein SmJEL517_g00054 [Synchytrium microbalum]TPX38266.1 hypothetical protein SmJEL517_g00054 [Synchytrium microbalum]
MAAQIDVKQFHKRADKYLTAWNDAKASGKIEDFDFDSMCVVVGDPGDEDSSYFKGTVVHNWLFGLEFPDTLMLVTPSKFVLLTSSKKAKYFEPLINPKQVDKSVTVEVLARTKDEKENADLFQTFISMIEGTRLGYFAKDRFSGKFLNEWNQTLSLSDRSFEKVDGTKSFSSVMAVKDDNELKYLRNAAKMSSLVLKNYLYSTILRAIDQGKKITHLAICEGAESLLEDGNQKKLAPLKIPADIEVEQAEWCYPPIIQSGGKYDLKASAESDESPLHAGTVLCSVGVRYNAYCSSIGRTLLFVNDKKRAKNYSVLVDLQKHLTSTVIRDGVACNDIYAEAQRYLEKEAPELVKHLISNLGSVIGIDFRDANFAINTKTRRGLRAGMVINLSIGFENLQSDLTDAKNRIYALLLTDTILVGQQDSIFLTDMSKALSDVQFNIKDDKAKENGGANNSIGSPQKKSKVVSSKLRNEDRDENASEEVKRKQHQLQLAQKRQQQGLEKYSNNNGEGPKSERAVFRKFETYRKDVQMPPDIRNLQIYVDKRAQAIILPIFGQAVPFHITTLKNVTKSDEGEYCYLRFNFVTPGGGSGPKGAKDLVFEDPNATFIRSFSYRSADLGRFSELHRDVTELKKISLKRESERALVADLVEQDKLIEVKGKRPARLGDCYARPQPEGKRTSGDLEIHTNGLRYVCRGRMDQKIDVLFSNMQHLFFQPCQGELIVIIHVHLKHPIMIGKKKTKDVQFYREVVDASFDETGNKKRRFNYGDEDELAAESEERKRRDNLDKEFKAFAEKISEATAKAIEVDVPYRELGFQGVPFKQNVLLQPTQNCLVHLTEPPFLVVTMSEIEIAHLERVSFGLKNFDLVFVFEDFHKPVVHINTIPMTNLDTVKSWLDESDVVHYEGPVNLNWGPIMKTITEDPGEFFQIGGWDLILRTDGDDDDDGTGSSEESEFEVGSGDASSESDSDASDYDSNASGGSGSSGSGSDDDDDEGGGDESDDGGGKKGRKRDDSDDDSDARKAKKAKR